MNELRVFPVDLHNTTFCGQAGLCMKGSRDWFAAHGIDWAAFVRDGILADTLLATGDAVAEAVVETARQRAESGDSK